MAIIGVIFRGGLGDKSRVFNLIGAFGVAKQGIFGIQVRLVWQNKCN